MRPHVADDQIVRRQRLSQIANDMLGPQGPSRRLRPLLFVCGLHQPAALSGPGEIERSKLLADLMTKPDKELDDLYVKLHGTIDREQRVLLTRQMVRRMREQMFGIPMTLIPSAFGVGLRVDWLPTAGFQIAQPLHRLTWRPGYP